MSTFSVLTPDGPRTIEAKDVQFVQGTEDGGIVALRHRAFGDAAAEEVRFTEPFVAVQRRLNETLTNDYRAARREQR